MAYSASALTARQPQSKVIKVNMKKLKSSAICLVTLAAAFAAAGAASAEDFDKNKLLINRPDQPLNSQDLTYVPVDFVALKTTEKMILASMSSTKCCASGTCDSAGYGPEVLCDFMPGASICW